MAANNETPSSQPARPDRVSPPLEFATLADIQRELMRRYQGVILCTFGGPEGQAKGGSPLRCFWTGHEVVTTGLLEATNQIVGSHLAAWNARVGEAAAAEGAPPPAKEAMDEDDQE